MAHWGEFKDNGIKEVEGRWVREYSAILWDIPPGESWEEACACQPADIHGVHFDHPTFCAKTGTLSRAMPTNDDIKAAGVWADLVFPEVGVVAAVTGATARTINLGGIGALNIWGYFWVVPAPRWGEFKDNGIKVVEGRKVREYSAILWDIPPGESWEEACACQPADIQGVHFDRPTFCVKTSAMPTIEVIATVGGALTALVFPPAAAVGAVVAAGAFALDLAGIGALNIWGVFLVSEP